MADAVAPNRGRRLFLGAAVAATVGAVAWKRPAEHGSGGHDAYFSQLQAALRRAGLNRPTLVIDRARLEHNIGRLKTHLPKTMHYRVVAKSLPSLELMRTVRTATGTDRLMVFDQPFLNFVAAQMPDAKVLLGKPMPAGAAKRFFDRLEPQGAEVAKSTEWLVDTRERLAQYAELARAHVAAGGAPLRVNLELDVGLHRGGIRSTDALGTILTALVAEPALAFAGFMGYEAHASKIPGFLGGPTGALAKAMAFYAECVTTAKNILGERFQPEALTLNAGGSSTYELYDETAPCNELAVGSALVMPTDFDKPTLADHQPACFIATPVLKALERTDLPGLESMTGVFRAWDRNTAQAFYLYGGYWLASPVSPAGLQRNAIWGHSTNQDLLNGSSKVELAVDDFVFLRPHQSEFVFLQFGDLAVYENGEIAQAWPVFSPGA